MDNSNLTITVEAKGVEEANRKLESLNATMTKMKVRQDGTVSATGKLTSALIKEETAMDEAGNATNRGAKAHANYFAHIAKTTVQSAIINKLFLEFVDVAGQAIESVDLMNNFPATMASMGQSTTDATEAMKTLNTYVGQIGGNIGQATSFVTRFTGVTKDVKAATAVYAGLNNALIAGDSSAEEQRQALLQFAQAFERGKPDMREWNSLTQNMSFQLAQVAKQMGYVNANALGQALRDGEESMGAFTTTLTEMSTGTGVIAQQAMTRMQGMQFAFNVLKNTMVQGLATIIQTIGRNNIVSFFTFGTQVVLVFTQAIVGAINVLISLASIISQLFGGPELGKMKGDTEGIADGLSGGAGAAGDLGDNLKGAKDDAKELNKSLASFDKMNVLADKTGKKKDDDTAGKGTVFDADQLGKLGDAFDGIAGKLKEAGIWAKILAGIIGTLIGLKFAQAMIDQVEGMTKSFATASKGATSFKDKLKQISTNASQFPTIIAGKMTGAKAGFASFGRLLMNPYVLAAVAVAALVGSIVWLYKTNEDFAKGFNKIWEPIIDTIKLAGEVMRNVFGDSIKWVSEQWEGLKPSLQPVIDLFNTFTGWLGDLSAKLGITGTNMEKFGKIIGVLGALFLALVLTPIISIIAALTLVALGFIAVVGAVTWFVKSSGELLANFIWDIKTGFERAWADVKKVWGLMHQWFINIFALTIIGIQDAWAGLGQFFLDAYNGMVLAWQDTATWFKTLFSNALLGMKLAWAGLTAWVQGAWNSIVAIFSQAPAWFGQIFQAAFVAVTNTFSNLWYWFKVNVWDRIVSLFSSLGTVVGDAISNAFRGVVNTAINSISNMINNFIRSINSAIVTINKIPGPQPDIARIPELVLPRLAKGGVVDHPTIAQIGENGQEAVVPLENNTEWIDKLAAKINASPSNNGQPLQLTVQIGEERIATKVVELINERTQMSGRNQVIV